jgi:uncharacterized Zn-binding protein involved in type VI secretion
MPRPIACLLDKTNHGGVITTPLTPRKVMVGPLVVACVGDLQVCPVVDGVKPHGGGPIQSGAAKVLVNGKPVARAGDRVQCAGPPGAIVAVRKVVIG